MGAGFIRYGLVLVAMLWAVAAGAQEAESISDTDMALGYYQPLAEQGEPYAQLTIGEIYMEGSGVSQNLIQAYAWFAVASYQGVEEAQAIMEHVLGKLSADEQAQAKVIAQQYITHYAP